MRVIYFGALYIIAMSCAAENSSNEKTINDFLQKDSQSIQERILKNDLNAIYEIVLDSIDVYGPYEFRGFGNNLFIRESPKITITQKNKLDEYYSIPVKKGSGPGELERLIDFDVSEKHIALLDPSRLKVVVLDHQGNLEHEYVLEDIRPERLIFYGHETFVIYSTIGSTYSFNILDFKGDVKNRFVKLIDNNVGNSLKVTGRIKAYRNHIYFVGYSESIIKKYDMNGDLIFSRSTIDDWPSEANYVTFEGGENIVGARYSPGALFAFFNFDIWSDYLVTIPHHNGDSEFKYLDIYHRNDGDYLGTLKTEGYASDVVVDGHHIFTMERTTDQRTIKKYPNELSQYFEE